MQKQMNSIKNDLGTYFDKYYPTLVMYNQIDSVFNEIRTNLMDLVQKQFL